MDRSVKSGAQKKHQKRAFSGTSKTQTGHQQFVGGFCVLAT